MFIYLYSVIFLFAILALSMVSTSINAILFDIDKYQFLNFNSTFKIHFSKLGNSGVLNLSFICRNQDYHYSLAKIAHSFP